MFHRLLASLTIAGLAALPAAVSAGADGKTARFAISVAGIPAGELTLSHRLDGERYEAGSEIRATGLLAAVARIKFDGSVTGRVAADGRLEPERYAAFSRSTRSERDTEIVFEHGNPVSVSVVPPRQRQVDVAAQAGTLDPVTAAFAVLRDDTPDRVCNDLVQLFDGSRRSELRVGGPEAAEDGLVCNGTYTRIEGESHSMSDQKDWGFRLVFLPNGDGSMKLHRIEAPTRFGLAVMERRG
jgi:Protein of unknown function (DUF3108)